MDVLKESLHNIAKPALDRLAERGPIASRLVNQVRHDTEGNVQMGSVIHDDYRSSILTEMDTMLGTPELSAQLIAVAEAVEADTQVHECLPVGLRGTSVTTEKITWVATYIVAPFLLHLCERFGGLWYKESWFEETYEAFRAYLAAEAVSINFIAPLDNFSATFDELDFDEHIHIARLSQQRSQLLWENHGGSPGLSPGLKPTEVLGWSHAIQGRVNVPKGEISFSRPARRVVDDVVTALRLYGPNRVSSTLISVALDPPDTFNPDVFRQDLLAPLPLRRPFYGSNYELRDQDTDQLRDLFNKLLASKTNPAYQLAVKRLNLGYDREDDKDRLIDYWVGLEALFASDSTQELRFRASLRIARYVGDSKAQREEIFKGMKASYDLRSKVVHGADIKLKPGQSLPDIVNSTEEALRKALLLWLDSGEPHALENIDASFLA